MAIETTQNITQREKKIFFNEGYQVKWPNTCVIRITQGEERERSWK